MLANDELRKIVLPRLEAEDYDELATAAIFSALRKLNEAGSEINFDSLSQELAGDAGAAELLPLLVAGEEPESFDEALTAADNCLKALRLVKLDRRIDEMRSEIAEAERAGNDQRRDTLAIEHLELSKRRGEFLRQAQATKS